MSDSKSKMWIGILGAALVAGGAALYYLAHEEDEKVIAYNPKEHTREKYLEIIKEFELEYASLYIHWYSMLKSKEKEVPSGKIPQEILEAARGQLKDLTDKTDEEVLENFKMTKSFFETWSEKFEKDPEVNEVTKNMQSNFERVLSVQRPNFDFEYPKELTKKKYLKFIKAAYSKFRYDVYHAIQKELKEKGKDELNDEEFNEILKSCSLPEIKEKAYHIMKLPLPVGEKPNRVALKAYLMMIQDDEAWHREIMHTQKEHKQILFQIPKGEKLPNMHEDPFDVLAKEVEIEEKGAKEAFVKQEKNDKSDKKGNKEADTQKKSVGGFSFLGNEEKQKKLVDDFLNRNKDKKEDKPEEKVQEIVEQEEVKEIKEEIKESVSESIDVINRSEVERIDQPIQNEIDGQPEVVGEQQDVNIPEESESLILQQEVNEEVQQEEVQEEQTEIKEEANINNEEQAIQESNEEEIKVENKEESHQSNEQSKQEETNNTVEDESLEFEDANNLSKTSN